MYDSCILNMFLEMVLKLDPALLDETGLSCFESFFRSVNIKEGYLTAARSGRLYLNTIDLKVMFDR